MRKSSIHPKSSRRAGRHVRAQLRQLAWQAVRRNSRLIVGFLLFCAAAIVALVMVQRWLGVSSILIAFLVGFLVGMVPWFGQMFLTAQGLSARFLGADAEQWTAEALGKLDSRRWHVFHDVPLRWGNIDHVAVGPGRVYAIETKFTCHRGKYLQGAVRQAQRQAELLAKELAARETSREVLPMLVVWGPGIEETLGAWASNGPADFDVAGLKAGRNHRRPIAHCVDWLWPCEWR